MEFNEIYKIEKCTKTNLLNLIINEVANGVRNVNVFKESKCIKSAQVGSKYFDSFESVVNHLYYQHIKNKVEIICQKVELDNGSIELWFAY